MPHHDTRPSQAFKAPNILPDELAAFHDAHFSSHSVRSFQQEFALPDLPATSLNNSTGEYWEEEDDLGYYEDGAKRTLTDEQIAIFRHSELRELERAKEKASKKPQSAILPEEHETRSFQHASGATAKPGDERKGKKRRNKQAKREPKPDLRKRTWDVVEAGLDSLDYD